MFSSDNNTIYFVWLLLRINLEKVLEKLNAIHFIENRFIEITIKTKKKQRKLVTYF